MNPARLLFTLLALGLAGCASSTPLLPANPDTDQNEIVLREGDQIRITFPGAPNLDTPPQPIRRDGKITLPLEGEVQAAGMTPAELQNKLIGLYGSQLVSKEIVVTVTGSSFSIYIDGPVGKPGKITSDHPLSVLEAIEEAGGFDYARADTKHIQVIRHSGRSKNYTYYTVNLNDVLTGKHKEVFYLASGDIVHVKEKFTIF